MKRIFVLFMFGICFSQSSSIFLGEDYESGYIPIDNVGNELFYWLFRPRVVSNETILLAWLQGGPGSSSMMGLFYELGPFHLINSSTTHKIELESNPYSWNTDYHIVFIEQPAGTGFSTISDDAHFCRNETCVCKGFYTFLSKFFYEYPEYENVPFYLTSESYGGHYLPSMATYLLKMNNSVINLKGISIGDGWVDPFIQYGTNAYFAYYRNLISFSEYIVGKMRILTCQTAIALHMDDLAGEICWVYLNDVAKDKFNIYDVRVKHPYDFSMMHQFLNRTDVREALGVGNKTYHGSSDVFDHMLSSDFNFAVIDKVKYLLESGFYVLLYQGNYDYCANMFGIEEWVRKLKWSGRKQFNNLHYKPFTINQKQVGEIKKLNNFVFINIYDAGHMVPMDQPEVALNLIRTFVNHNFTY